jgi:hypothetical protein
VKVPTVPVADTPGYILVTANGNAFSASQFSVSLG